MSDGTDPSAVTAALDSAEDAFEMVGSLPIQYEPDIKSDGDWKTQLTKACKLLDVVTILQDEDDYFTASIELCFGAIERSIEAYAIAMGGDEIADFDDHEESYDRASAHGLFSQETTRRMQDLYGENRTESYYGGNRPTQTQSEAMHDLAEAVHEFVVDQIREGGVCVCESA